MGSRITLKLIDSMTELPNELKSHMKEIVEKHVHACNDANGRRKHANSIEHAHNAYLIAMLG